ncbi:transcriptional regulator [Lactococcus lactis subsp. lactis]|uniref:helix-turn-helix domain-containing protein n=1 Tax=Lactobacillales TaxID=186826 RepID=UPI000200CF8F|nr:MULTISPECIES: helix-turn-helix transcriptional regulator [Lactobacillales]ADZ65062.1 transcriptional regulator, XRE family [Lactococcus lactis subsp. lactis CV56]KAF0951705.1 transcriptional regulator [Lactococcus lactis subsp. lactis]QQB12832.1 helix-turn-helix transcriptional regulator [Lactococcus lactis]RQE17464.1 XRE family transcriptional regulator [Lactococcus lactis]RQE21954.1 XRE family transcriptional regulator [Lactococcus lactis]
MNIIKIFGNNVKRYRLKMGLSQEKFAELCNLHRTYISDIECFQRNVSLESVQKIAEAIQIEPYKLLIEGMEEE